MTRIGFTYCNRSSHYEHSRNQSDTIRIIDNYFNWVDIYLQEGPRVYHQDETWVFKKMADEKVWKDVFGNATENYYTAPPGRE